MPDGLYERDVLAWSERQADLLRRLAAGERLNEAVDWPNVIDEVETVGRSELRSCESLLRQALVHLLKLHAWPGSQAAAHWRAETIGILADAGQCFSPSMRRRIDLDELYRKALKQARSATDDTGEPRPLPEACPFLLDDLLDPNADPQVLAKKMEIS
jgi:hypothetical protein